MGSKTFNLALILNHIVYFYSMSFIKEFFNNKSEVGAVAPSSKFLAKKMLGGIDFNNTKCIVEFGPGTGVFTRKAIEKMSNDCFLLVFETNEAFYIKLKQEINDPRVLVLNDSAEKIGEILKEQNQPKADVILSSLPLTVFPKELKESILSASLDALKKDGIYVQFQYSLNALKLLKGKFNSVKLAFTPINMPPAFVYRCKNN